MMVYYSFAERNFTGSIFVHAQCRSFLLRHSPQLIVYRNLNNRIGGESGCSYAHSCAHVVHKLELKLGSGTAKSLVEEGTAPTLRYR